MTRAPFNVAAAAAHKAAQPLPATTISVSSFQFCVCAEAVWTTAVAEAAAAPAPAKAKKRRRETRDFDPSVSNVVPPFFMNIAFEGSFGPAGFVVNSEQLPDNPCF
jgi:hypothetical protein